MAKKKTSNKKSTSLLERNIPLPKLPKSKYLSKKYIKRAVLVALIVFPLSFFLYNLYLDKQNVQDMKQLLTEFQQLETDIEAETGEEFSIEADCGSGGKFATFYSCTVYLRADKGWGDDFSNVINSQTLLNKDDFGGCRLLSDSSVGFEPRDNKFICSFIVRQSVTSSAEDIFLKYDESPGRAI